MIGCDTHWVPVGGALIRVCKRCHVMSAVVTRRPRPAAIDALQNTDGRPAEGWPGCID